MKRISTVTLAITLLSTVAPVQHAAFASGSQPRAWVSVARGIDQAGCGTAPSPCKTFQYAFTNAVVSGGSILVMDPGGYGPITITNPISIINDGVGTAGMFIANATGNAIDINLPAGGQVTLKGLTVDGAATGQYGNGIYMKSSGILTIVNCMITGFAGNNTTGSGLYINPASGIVDFNISDSVFSGNGGSGVLIIPGYGAPGSASAAGVLRNVALTNNDLYGIFATTYYTSGTVSATIEDSLVSKNTYGIATQGGGTSVRINRVNATLNILHDLYDATGTLTSMGTNLYDNTSGTISTAPLH